MNSPSDASLLAWLRLQQPPSSLAACASLSDLSDGVALAAAFNALAPPHLATICAEEPVARLEALSAVLSSQCAQLGLSVALQLEEPRVALAQGRTTTLTRRLVEAQLGYATTPPTGAPNVEATPTAHAALSAWWHSSLEARIGAKCGSCSIFGSSSQSY